MGKIVCRQTAVRERVPVWRLPESLGLGLTASLAEATDREL
jgi:hypothetical protein